MCVCLRLQSSAFGSSSLFSSVRFPCLGTFCIPQMRSECCILACTMKQFSCEGVLVQDHSKTLNDSHQTYSPVSNLIVVPKARLCLCGEPDLVPCPCLNYDQAWVRPTKDICCSLFLVVLEKKNKFDVPTVSLIQSRFAESLINVFPRTGSTMVNVCNSSSCNIRQLTGACESASPARKWLNS